jgi:class 3 adenylate cyclase
VDLPTGTVTLLFTDIEGSTALAERLGDGWPALLADHHRLLREAFNGNGGLEFGTEGDAFFVVFRHAPDAVAAAAAAQRSLAAHRWPHGAQLRVRIGVHTGAPTPTAEGYVGIDLHRAARVAGAAHGGQVLVSETTRALVRGELDGLSLQDVGEHRLKDIDEPERLFALRGPGLRHDLPPPAPVAPSTEMVQAVAGREIELANQALARVRELELGPLESLGPAIERQVQDALKRTPSADRDRVAKDITSGLEHLQKLPVSPGWIILISVVVGLAITVGLIALLIWLVTLFV